MNTDKGTPEEPPTNNDAFEKLDASSSSEDLSSEKGEKGEDAGRAPSAVDSGLLGSSSTSELYGSSTALLASAHKGLVESNAEVGAASAKDSDGEDKSSSSLYVSDEEANQKGEGGGNDDPSSAVYTSDDEDKSLRTGSQYSALTNSDDEIEEDEDNKEDKEEGGEEDVEQGKKKKKGKKKKRVKRTPLQWVLCCLDAVFVQKTQWDPEEEEKKRKKADKKKSNKHDKDKEPKNWKQRVLHEVKKHALDKGNIFLFCFALCVAVLFLFMGIFVWYDFTWKGWFSLFVVVITFMVLIKNPCDPSITMMLSTTVIVAAQIITPARAISGFASTGVFTIAVLFVIAAAIANTGSLNLLVRYILRKPRGLFCALFRLCIPIGLLSAFINNTPLAAMMIPVVEQWCQKTKISPSKLMIPLSYSTIIGGTCTMIGTSTNLIVKSLANARDSSIDFPFFEVGIVGWPIFATGILYLLFVTHWLLPTRRSPVTDFFEDPRSYVIGAVIKKKSPIIGKTLEEAGLRHLKGLFLVEVHRNGTVIPAVDHDTHLFDGDALLFAGDVTQVPSLWQIKGLTPFDHEKKLIKPRKDRIIVEATVSPRSSQLLKKRINKLHFRAKYGAAIMCVYRNGEPLHTRIGDIKLKGGDVLLLVTKSDFLEKYETYGREGDFILANQVGSRPLKRDWPRLIFAPFCAIVMIVLNAADVTDLLTASLCALFAIIVTGCISWQGIKVAVNIPVIVTIAASFAMADALDVTGVAKELAANLITITKWSGDWGLLYGIYLSTALLTALLSNASAAAILVPVVFGLVQAGSSIPIKAFLYVIMVGASADFSTPIGYQTNLMVWGPGGYKFLDYTRVGMPLQFILSLISVTIIYLVWAS